MKSQALNFREASAAALKNPALQSALSLFAKGFPENRKRALRHFPEFEAVREKAAAIKDAALGNLEELHAKFKANMESRGATVMRCETAAAANAAITDICRRHRAKLIVKSKSMVSEEIGLNAALEAEGMEVVETDLGEYIVQIAGEPPSHIVGPALHKTRAEVAALFREKHKRPETPGDGEGLVREAREILRGKYFAADVGINGANFLIADPGAALIVTNEGNADLCRNLPKTHIIVSSIEKVIPALDDAAVFLRLLARSASGQHITTYTTLVTGKRAPHEAGGPENLYIVLVDNGRSRLLGTEQQVLLRCIKCAACMNACPVYGAVGGHAYGWVYPGPLGAAVNPALLGPSDTRHLYQASTFCGACEEVCPVKIPLTKIFRHWREVAFEKGFSPRAERLGLRLWAFAATRPWAFRIARALVPWVLRLRAGGKGYLKRVWPVAGWSQGRVLPAPERRRP
ncbi:MAG TPA: lactate utilization protein B [Sphingomonadales bacterium]|nr:lactate utilization protein B [Sphingomonadales bacterium]